MVTGVQRESGFGMGSLGGGGLFQLIQQYMTSVSYVHFMTQTVQSNSLIEGSSHLELH